MADNLLERRFAEMGARVKLAGDGGQRLWTRAGFSIDIASDKAGEHFVLRGIDKAREVRVLDVRPKDRHLLLMIRPLEREEKQKFLCGHDERHWFVAAVPEKAAVASVAEAKDALKPALVQREEARKAVRPRDRNRRKTAAFRRQGEWFFVPRPELSFPEAQVLRNEPLRRGRGKPHTAQECYRTGGVVVYVSPTYPNGVSESMYARILQRNPKAKGWNWQVMRANMQVYVRGRITHADHKTVVLPCWHLVVMNTETESLAMRNVAFLD